ncbi:MAG: leucine-rich repeat domain-containing protein [Clostridia bacterium]|nr:leucine-rich repeat domain-containing protein [Clostridia bacterium]
MKRYLRPISILLSFIIILPLSACFDPNYDWDLSGKDPEILPPIFDLPEDGDKVYETTVAFDGLELTLSSDGTYYYVTDGSKCTATVVSIPESVNGLPVEAIYKFGTNNKVETLLIPEGIKNISGYAFDRCPNLKYTEYGNAKYLGNMENEYIGVIEYVNRTVASVDIHPNRRVIADEALASCEKLSKVSFAEGLEYIGEYAFSNCDQLTELILPDSLKFIGFGAFSQCEGIAEIVFGDSIETIQSNAFAHLRSLRSVEIPDSVTELGSSVFNQCTSLEKVVIGDGIEALPSYTFYQCSSLKYVDFGSSIRELGEYAFSYCTALTDIVIPSTVEVLYAYTFQTCDNLKYNYYGKELRYLPGENGEYEYLVSYIYDTCEKVVVHPDTRIVSKRLFQPLKKLKEISMDGEGKYLAVSGNCLIDKATKTLIAGINTSVIPDDGSVEAIGDCAFYGMLELSLTRIPEGVKTIGNSAFRYCEAIESIEFPAELRAIGSSAFLGSAVRSVKFPEGLESIGNNAFASCPITELYLPSGLRELGESAFSYNDKLVSVEIADGLTEIGRQCFRGCRFLRKVILPETLESISDLAFYECRSLEAIDFSSNLKSIGLSAFEASGLKSVSLPNSVHNIGETAFGDSRITTVYLGADVAYIGNGAFSCALLESLSYGGTLSKWNSLTNGDYDMFRSGQTVTVKCSDGEIECLGAMKSKSQNSAYD